MRVGNIFLAHFFLISVCVSLIISSGHCSESRIRECEFVSEGEKMCDGEPYFEQVVSTPGFCEKYRCESDSRCSGFSFFVSENKCSLFENCNMDTLVDCSDSYSCITGLCYNL